MSNSKQQEEDYHLQLYKRFSLTISHGAGVWVYDDKGQKYLDAVAGIAVNNVGHCHPEVVKAIQEQAGKLIHVSNLYFNEPQSNLAQKLAGVSGMDRIFFCNSGAEANEAAIKFARNYASKKNRNTNIIGFEGCFHGRTLATLALGKKQYQEGFGPVPAGFELLPFNNTEALKQYFNTEAPAAVILEIVQGEGGVNIAEREFLKELSDLCAEHDTLLICDEIQCGFGRTGKFFSYEHFNLKPDIISCAKGMGGGVPIGAVLLNQKTADLLTFGQHGTTFGGNPLACAASLAVLEILEKENLVAETEQKGLYLLQQLRLKLKHNKLVKDIRGLGLMAAVELNIEGKEIVKIMMEKGVLINCTAEKVIRLIPPLVIEKDEIDLLVDNLLTSINEF